MADIESARFGRLDGSDGPNPLSRYRRAQEARWESEYTLGWPRRHDVGDDEYQPRKIAKLAIVVRSELEPGRRKSRPETEFCQAVTRLQYSSLALNWHDSGRSRFRTAQK